MRRVPIVTLFIGLLAASSAGFAAPQSAAPVTAERMLDRCKPAPGICKAIVAAEASSLVTKGEACIPNNVSKEEVAERVTDTAADVVDESPDAFKDADYTVLVDQIILLLWNCKDRPVS